MDLKNVLVRNVQQALRRGDLEEAAAALDHLRAEDPLSVETRGLEVEHLLAAGRLDEAARLAAQVVETFPGSARIQYLAGRIAFARRDYRSACERFEESQRLRPHPWCRRFLGKSLINAGRFDEAEAALLELLPSMPDCRLDLAWLYERRGDLDRAAKELDAYLERSPENASARARRRRLESLRLDPGTLSDEVDGLVAHGEDVPDDLLPGYIADLIGTGRVGDAIEFLRPRLERLPPRLVLRIAWDVYKRQVHDLAAELFLRVFPESHTDAKYINALEAAARRAGRLADLLPLYAQHAPANPRLYGRMRNIHRRLDEDRSASS